MSRSLDLCNECATPVARLHQAGEHHDMFTPVPDDQIAEARRRRTALEQ